MRIEAHIEKTVRDAAKKAGWFYRKVKWRDNRNAPDNLFLKSGRYVWIEFKSPGEPAREAQLEEHGRMRAAGAEVHVVDLVSKGLRILGIEE